MLPIVLVLIEAFGHALQSADRALAALADIYGEAMENWRKAARKYPFAE